MKFLGQNLEMLEVVEITSENANILNTSKPSELSLLWFKSPNNKVNIDAVDSIFNEHDIISFTEFHTLKVHNISKAILIRWNRDLYCVVDHDSEVSCKGILYYGASTVPVIHPKKEDIEILETVYKMLLIEMLSKDSLQLEMLQMMLKRLLIICTRIYKNQNINSNISDKNIDIIREYNYLVEQHFRTKHSVKEYADLLYKSPKTLSNLFKKKGEITPLQYIHNRIMLEARRLLTYTEKPVSSISYELGFNDIQTFSRFFKKHQGVSPQNFK